MSWKSYIGRAFNILKNQVDEVVNQRTLLWKFTFGLSTKAIDKKGDEEEKDPKKDDEEKYEHDMEILIREGIVEGNEETIEKATDEENKIKCT